MFSGHFEHLLVISLVFDLRYEFRGRTSEKADRLTYKLQAIDTQLLNQESELEDLRAENQMLESELEDLRAQLAGTEHRGLMTRREIEDLEQFAHQLYCQKHPLANLLSRLATNIPPVE